MAYLDEQGLKQVGKKIAEQIRINTVDNENIFTESYCKSANAAYTTHTYTSATFPFKWHINDGTNIYIDGFSAAGLADDDFDKINVFIEPKYTIDGVGYTVTGIGDFGFALNMGIGKDEAELAACHDMISINLPATLTHIGERAFFDNLNAENSNYIDKRHLTYVNGTDNVTEVGLAVFGNCVGIESLYLPKLATLTPNLFTACNYLKTVCLGDVTAIPDGTFSKCFRLKEIRKSDGGKFNITSIGYQSFYRCSNLEKFDFAPETVKSIGEEAFIFCGLSADWKAMRDNGCTFGLRATVLQMWTDEVLEANYRKPVCINTNGHNFAFQQRFSGWANTPIHKSEEYQFGGMGCSWMSATAAYNILSGQRLTPLQFNNMIAYTVGEEFANNAISLSGTVAGSVTCGMFTYHKMNRLQTIEDIQGVYDGLAQGKIYSCQLCTKYQQGGVAPTGAHAHLLVGVDNDGKAIMLESTYGGMKYNLPTSDLIHIDLFNWFTNNTYGNNYLYNWVCEVTYDPNYTIQG